MIRRWFGKREQDVRKENKMDSCEKERCRWGVGSPVRCPINYGLYEG